MSGDLDRGDLAKGDMGQRTLHDITLEMYSPQGECTGKQSTSVNMLGEWGEGKVSHSEKPLNNKTACANACKGHHCRM